MSESILGIIYYVFHYRVCETFKAFIHIISIQAYIRAYIHIHLHTYMHTCIHTGADPGFEKGGGGFDVIPRNDTGGPTDNFRKHHQGSTADN